MESEFDQEIVDRKEAEFINFLVDMGVINKTRIYLADKNIIHELLERNEEEIVLHGEKDKDGKAHEIAQEKIDKIKVLLGSRELQSSEKIEQNVEIAQIVLEELKAKTKFPITGVIIYGSRVDENKNPNDLSDLDIIVYVNSRDLLVGTETQLDIWQQVIKEMNLPIQVNIGSALDRQTLVRSVAHPDKNSPELRWRWNPNAIRFVGVMYIDGKGLKNDDATDYLRDKLTTPEWDVARDNCIKDIEKRIAYLISRD